MKKYMPLIVSGISAIMVLLILMYSLGTTTTSMTGSFISGFVTQNKGYLLFIAALLGTCISCVALKCYFEGKCS